MRIAMLGTAPGNSWKVLEFDFQNFQALEVPEKDLSPGNSWKPRGIFMKYSWNFHKIVY
jgi:hypothetical protein